MNISAPTWVRALTMIGWAILLALAPASIALAHNGTGGETSDYRISITGYVGDPTGVLLRVVELGNRVELVRNEADEVLVLGYEGEQYLRLDQSGVWENINSPAHYLNIDRFAAEQPPPGITAESEPSWHLLTTGNTIRWHDHRTHWMSPVPPQSVSDNPDVERLVRTDHVDLVVDGRPVSAAIEIVWLPPPNRTIWLAVASVLGAATAALLVLSAGAHRLIPIVAIDAAILAMLGQGSSVPRLVVGGLVVACAVAAAWFRRPMASVGCAAAATVLAATRLEAFEHELLAGWLGGTFQRVCLVVAFGFGSGVVAAGLVSILGPTPTPAPAPAPSPTPAVSAIPEFE